MAQGQGDLVAEQDTKPKTGDDKQATPPAAAQPAVAPEEGARRRRPRTDLTTGSIPKKLFAQAWPQVIENVLNIADQFVDLFWAGRLPAGFRAIASIGVAQTFTQFAGQARMGFDVSMRAMIARAVGARNIPLANHVLFQGLSLTAVYSLFMVLVGIFLTDFFLNLINASDALRDQTSLYMRVQFIGNATQNFRMSTGTALQASGEPIVPLRATTVSRLIHIGLSPFLIFGWWIFPEIGLAGSALANVLAQAVGVAMNMYALMGGHGRLKLTLRGNRLDPPLILRQVRIGAPASVRGTERATSQLALLGIVSPFGDVALAGYALTRRLEMFSNFGSGGIAQASGVMVGQNLGAGHAPRARQTVGWALMYVAAMKSTIIGLFWIFPFAAIMVFTKDPAVVDLTMHWVRIQLFGAFFQGLMQVFQESFNGAGDTLTPMVVTLFGVWCIEVPLAWFLCTQTSLGPVGIAYASILGFVSRTLIFMGWYFYGRWLNFKVF